MGSERADTSQLALLLRRDAPDAARLLLGMSIARRTPTSMVRARIVEVEAYREDDPASHSYRGQTERNASMFARPATAYVYRAYGVHWCLNIAVEEQGRGAAVLVRAAEVLEGIADVRALRPRVVNTSDLLRGPGCLTAGLDIDGTRHDGVDLLHDDDLWLEANDDWPLPERLCRAGPRVGVSRAVEAPWRLWIDGAAAVSRYRRSARASV